MSRETDCKISPHFRSQLFQTPPIDHNTRTHTNDAHDNNTQGTPQRR
jgi:hypothetical protein